MKKIICILFLLIFILVVGLIIYKVKNSTYKNIAKEFSEACNSEEMMDKFVDKRFDVKAICAIKKVSQEKNQDDKKAFEKAFKEEYKKVSKDDIEKASKELKELMREYISTEDKIKFKSIEKPDEYEKIPFLKVADAVYEVGTDTADVEFYFYKNKIILIEIEAVYDKNELENNSEETNIDSIE